MPADSLLTDKRVVVTGGTGSLGQALVRRLLEGELGLPADVVRTSGELGADKPSREFFLRFAAEAGLKPQEAAYVGDRIDNDVLPAQEVGMRMNGPLLPRASNVSAA